MYLTPISNRQISRLYESRNDDIIKLLRKHAPQGILIKNIDMTKPDAEIYQLFREKRTTTKDDLAASSFIVDKYLTILRDYNRLWPILSFCDVGCGDGSKTEQLAEKLNVTGHGCDIKTWGHYENKRRPGFIFAEIPESGILPYEDSRFDIVFSFQVMHHISIDAIGKYIREIWRILKPYGVFMFREHDCRGAEDRMLIDVEHAIYESTYPDRYNPNFAAGYSAYYRSEQEWRAIIERNGFAMIEMEADSAYNPTRPFHGLFMKV